MRYTEKKPFIYSLHLGEKIKMRKMRKTHGHEAFFLIYIYEMTMPNWGELGQGRSGHQS